MKEPAPKGEAGADEATGLKFTSLTRYTPVERGIVRTRLSNSRRLKTTARKTNPFESTGFRP